MKTWSKQGGPLDRGHRPDNEFTIPNFTASIVRAPGAIRWRRSNNHRQQFVTVTDRQLPKAAGSGERRLP